jgi:hypothetical protein
MNPQVLLITGPSSTPIPVAVAETCEACSSGVQSLASLVLLGSSVAPKKSPITSGGIRVKYEVYRWYSWPLMIFVFRLVNDGRVDGLPNTCSRGRTALSLSRSSSMSSSDMAVFALAGRHLRRKPMTTWLVLYSVRM